MKLLDSAVSNELFAKCTRKQLYAEQRHYMVLGDSPMSLITSRNNDLWVIQNFHITFRGTINPTPHRPLSAGIIATLRLFIALFADPRRFIKSVFDEL